MHVCSILVFSLFNLFSDLCMCSSIADNNYFLYDGTHRQLENARCAYITTLTRLENPNQKCKFSVDVESTVGVHKTFRFGYIVPIRADIKVGEVKIELEAIKNDRKKFNVKVSINNFKKPELVENVCLTFLGRQVK